MSTTFRLAELADVPSGRYRLDTAAGSSSPAGDLSLTEPLLLIRQGQPPAPVKSSTGLPVLYAKRLGLGDRVLATVMLAADSQAPGTPGGAAGATLQALADLDAAKAPLVSPAFTGTPTAPTAAAGTNTTQVATTAFTRGEVAALVASAPGTLDTLGEIAAALASDESAATALATTVASKAPLASPVFTGNPTAPTPTAGDNDTSIATTAFVKTAVGSSVASPGPGDAGKFLAVNGTEDGYELVAAPSGGGGLPLTAGAEMNTWPSAGAYGHCILIPGDTHAWRNEIHGSTTPWNYDAAHEFVLTVHAPTFTAGMLKVQYAEMEVVSVDGTVRKSMGLYTPRDLTSGEDWAVVWEDDQDQSGSTGAGDLDFTGGVLTTTAGGLYSVAFYILFRPSGDLA